VARNGKGLIFWFADAARLYNLTFSDMIDFSFTPFPFLTTENYALRNLLPEDDQQIFALRSSDEINKYLARPKANTLDDARDFISKIINGVAKNESILWVVTSRNDPKFLGTICLWRISREQATAEMGYELLPENHGRGIMQEVIPRVIQFGFEDIKLETIEAESSPQNLKSIRLLEKNDFKLAEADEQNPDSQVYALKKTVS
jgi:ribosomal-protein-alanine N-acetyltransferase